MPRLPPKKFYRVLKQVFIPKNTGRNQTDLINAEWSRGKSQTRPMGNFEISSVFVKPSERSEPQLTLNFQLPWDRWASLIGMLVQKPVVLVWAARPVSKQHLHREFLNARYGRADLSPASNKAPAYCSKQSANAFRLSALPSVVVCTSKSATEDNSLMSVFASFRSLLASIRPKIRGMYPKKSKKPEGVMTCRLTRP